MVPKPDQEKINKLAKIIIKVHFLRNVDVNIQSKLVTNQFSQCI